jgi:formylmethanofuran dehydrogenase subunit E
MRNLAKKIFSGQATPAEKQKAEALRDSAKRRYFDAPLDELFVIREAAAPAPRGPQILDSLTCAACGEATMESRIRLLEGRTYCIPCFEDIDQKR